MDYVPTFDDSNAKKEIHPEKWSNAAADVRAASIQIRSAGPHPAATRIPVRPESTKMDDAERASNWAHSAQTSLGPG